MGRDYTPSLQLRNEPFANLSQENRAPGLPVISGDGPEHRWDTLVQRLPRAVTDGPGIGDDSSAYLRPAVSPPNTMTPLSAPSPSMT